MNVHSVPASVWEEVTVTIPLSATEVSAEFSAGVLIVVACFLTSS